MLSQSEQSKHGLKVKALAGNLDGIGDLILSPDPEAMQFIVGALREVAAGIEELAVKYGADVGD